MEKIGRVNLDYSKYLGKDLYCDGAVEDELLDIVKNKVPAEYGKVIEERKSWPILYHLSALRENIVDWVPMPVKEMPEENAAGSGDMQRPGEMMWDGRETFRQGTAAQERVTSAGESVSAVGAALSGKGAFTVGAALPGKGAFAGGAALPGEGAFIEGAALSGKGAFTVGAALPGESVSAVGAVLPEKGVSAVGNALSGKGAFAEEVARDGEKLSGSRTASEEGSAAAGEAAVGEEAALARGKLRNEGKSSVGGDAFGGRKLSAGTLPKGAKVLEVGSGCGAVTGALARKAASVTCVELSKKRSLINAYRHRECGNVTIHVGNFKDIEPVLPADYDFIFLIGVFEYAQSYMGGETPYEDFLKSLLPHLAEGGRLIIAIENRYGLKYFAGCKEDHLGTYFSGIENYAAGGGVRTFSREGLERIFLNCGVEEYHFYYPYPDYKFMTALYSDEYLPKKGELCSNLRNFDRDRMLLFDEKHAFDGLVEDGLFPVFSNSYLAVIGEPFETKYVKYSNDRAPEYAVRTEIAVEDRFVGRPGQYGGMVCVRKYPMNREAEGHVRGMVDAYESLVERYQGSGLEINRCGLVEDGSSVYVQFEYVPGVPLSELMDRCLEKDDLDGFYSYFRQYVERIGYNSEYPAADFDLAFSNILVQEGIPGEGQETAQWTLIDYEWTFGRAIETKELAFRAVYCYLLEDAKRGKLQPDRVLRELALTEEAAEQYRQQEREFQRFVTGDRASMGEIREKIGRRTIIPQKWIDKYQDSDQVQRVQIYEDRGGGYSEAESYFAKDAYQGDSLIVLELRVGSNVKSLRIDPAMCPCAVKIKEMTFNGEAVPLDKKKVLSANGRIVKQAEKHVENVPSIVFATDDPNISIMLGGLRRQEENLLRARLEIVRLPLDLAQDLANVKGTRLF